VNQTETSFYGIGSGHAEFIFEKKYQHKLERDLILTKNVPLMAEAT
jgi:hypothetical protein